ncbi:MAG: hypothetical protein HOQ24_16350, partial [Mycobacteriaceae bacterium]|nr:hypothetical protein [Mycobacteriaceae bacterium]
MADGKSGWGSVLPNVAWVTAAVGAPTAAVGVLHGFVARHPVWAVVLVVGYEIVLGAVRFAGRIVAVWAARAQDEIAAGGWVRLRSWVSRFGRRYRRWLLAGLEQVDLRGLGTVADTAPLLDRVYVDVRLVRRPQHEIARAQLFSDTIPAQRPDRLSLFDLLGAAGSTVAVLGAPGSGKTTLVRHAARMAYRKRFGRNTVPVLLYLREHS